MDKVYTVRIIMICFSKVCRLRELTTPFAAHRVKTIEEFPEYACSNSSLWRRWCGGREGGNEKEVVQSFKQKHPLPWCTSRSKHRISLSKLAVISTSPMMHNPLIAPLWHWILRTFCQVCVWGGGGRVCVGVGRCVNRLLLCTTFTARGNSGVCVCVCVWTGIRREHGTLTVVLYTSRLLSPQPQ